MKEWREGGRESEGVERGREGWKRGERDGWKGRGEREREGKEGRREEGKEGGREGIVQSIGVQAV